MITINLKKKKNYENTDTLHAQNLSNALFEAKAINAKNCSTYNIKSIMLEKHNTEVKAQNNSKNVITTTSHENIHVNITFECVGKVYFERSRHF